MSFQTFRRQFESNQRFRSELIFAIPRSRSHDAAYKQPTNLTTSFRTRWLQNFQTSRNCWIRQLFTTSVSICRHYSSLENCRARNVIGILLTLFDQSTIHKGKRRYSCACVRRVRVRNLDVEASHRPKTASSSFSRPVLMRQALLGPWMVVSRMLTRHRHEPRARLRSATSGTTKRRGKLDNVDSEMLDSRQVLRFSLS